MGNEPQIHSKLGNLHTPGTGELSHTSANWGTYIHRELRNFRTHLPIGELTHTGN